METKPEKTTGKSNLFTIVLSLLLVISLVLNVVLYLDKGTLSDKVNTLTGDNTALTDQLTAAAQQAADADASLAAANQTIEKLTADTADINTAMAALQTEYDAYQADAKTALDAAVQKGEADVKAAQEEGAKALAELQAAYDAYKAETDAALAPAAEVEPVESVAADTTVSTEEPAEDVSAFSIAADAVVATVNGEDITGAMVKMQYDSIVGYYGEPSADYVEYYNAYAMEQAVTMVLIRQTAAELGLDQFTQEETDALYATSDSAWAEALDSYVSYYFTLTDESTDEEKADAYAQAEAYYNEQGYTQESLRDSYLENALYERVTTELCKDTTVTDEEVNAAYQEDLANDRALYEFDANAYETQVMMYQYGYADDLPMYHPEGYRYVKHILLSVDSDLLAAYTDLAAKYEAQSAADATATDAAEEPVTAEQVAEAKAAVIASVQVEIDDINKQLAEGTSFEDLIALYGTDPGMTSGSYPDGYEVSEASTGFVPEFVNAAFSLSAIGDVSEPVLSDYGVHIVKYAGDVPGGPVELTAEEADFIRENLLAEKNGVLMTAWHDAADIQYTGIIRSIDELQAEEAAAVAQ